MGDDTDVHRRRFAAPGNKRHDGQGLSSPGPHHGHGRPGGGAAVSDDPDDWFEGDDEDPFDGDGDMFDEDFESAFEGGGDAGDAEFDEDFDSDIPRIDLGIEGLDEMVQGGVPERALLVVIGAAGTGKTTFGLQFLQEGLRNGDNAVFITLEETREAILAAANEKGWDFEQRVADDELAVVDLDPVEMANSLASIRNDLPQLVDEFGADRLVLDSVSLLEMMYDQQARRRTEVFDFTKSLKQAGVTTMLTSEASESNPYASRHGIIEYLTDGVFVLQYVRSEFRETRLAVEIQKIRNANHSRETKPYEITNDGISVYQQANIF
ncbi:KaiC domain-containing protein [Halorarius halobius]|uniref:KaiC domain-containing protein n=1 Tax=Halorarius halobius TaxID=2962671 RepID=UPI003D9C830A